MKALHEVSSCVARARDDGTSAPTFAGAKSAVACRVRWRSGSDVRVQQRVGQEDGIKPRTFPDERRGGGEDDPDGQRRGEQHAPEAVWVKVRVVFRRLGMMSGMRPSVRGGHFLRDSELGRQQVRRKHRCQREHPREQSETDPHVGRYVRPLGISCDPNARHGVDQCNKHAESWGFSLASAGKGGCRTVMFGSVPCCASAA
jgi:hypothetical protein